MISIVGPLGITPFCSCTYCFCCTFSWTWWSAAFCSEMSSLLRVEHMCLYLCLSPATLILCLSVSLGATLFHCHWLILSVHACWGLLQVFAEGRVTSVEWSEQRLQETGFICIFTDHTTKKKCFFILVWAVTQNKWWGLKSVFRLLSTFTYVQFHHSLWLKREHVIFITSGSVSRYALNLHDSTLLSSLNPKTCTWVNRWLWIVHRCIF